MRVSLSLFSCVATHCGGKILLNLAENTAENSAIHYASHNVMTVIARRIVLVCKAVVHRPHYGPGIQSPTPVMSRVNRAFKMSFQISAWRRRRARTRGVRRTRNGGLGAPGPPHRGFNQEKGSEDVMKMRRWPLFAVCHGIDFPDTMLQCMTDQSN